MPRSNNDTTPLCRIKNFDMFTERERHILNTRVVLDDPRKIVQLSGIGLKRALTILVTDWRLWGHFTINLAALAPKGALGLYSPTIIKSLGFGTVKANALASVSNFGVCLLALICAWISDKTRVRGVLCLVAAGYSLVFSGVQYGIVKSKDAWLKYAILTILNTGNAVAQSINDAWLSTNSHDPQNRCIGIALAVAGSNLGGLIGQDYFRSSDAPYYPMGFMRIMVSYAGSFLAILLMMGLYWYENRRMTKQAGAEVVTGDGVDVVTENARTARVKNEL